MASQGIEAARLGLFWTDTTAKFTLEALLNPFSDNFKAKFAESPSTHLGNSSPSVQVDVPPKADQEVLVIF